MLKKVLSYSDCSSCKFCCAFRRRSLWETPFFPEETAKKLESGGLFEYQTVNGSKCAKMVLENKYKTDDPEEEAPCHFLKKDKGCTLSEEDKPFDCKIWPLRVMKKDNELVIALTPTCPAINKVGIEKMTALVKNGLAEKIFSHAESHPYVIKEYKDGFAVLDVKK